MGGAHATAAAPRRPGQAPAAVGDDDELNQAGLRMHNEYRRQHGCPDMVIDKKVRVPNLKLVFSGISLPSII